MKRTLAVALIALAGVVGGCKEDKSQGGASSGGGTGSTPATQSAAAPSHANRTMLGETTVGGLKLVAMQDEPVKAGGEGAFDLVITGGKPKAVRFWVGTENAEGSVKAKADEESPDNWHTHAEVPDPLPPGSKFWAEIEPAAGQPFKVSFDLKQ